jgi:two-component system chemotaxis sensor kinase CheA
MACDVPSLAELDAEVCYLNWDLVLTSDRGRNAIDDVFIFVMEDWDISIEIVDDGNHWSDTPENRPIGEILVERGDARPEQVAHAREKQKRIGEILSESEHIQPDKIRSALKEQQVVREVQKQRQEQAGVANVKVPADKLDILMDLVGELVIAQARLNQTANDMHNPVLTSVAEDMERLTTELRDNTLGLRMLPIGTTFARFRRLVRDLSNELGKQIELVTEGAETELDKTVIDRLGDPLVHLIRNSIDHGIETPERRQAAGKPARGTVKLSAIHSESHVVIRIEDDGAGLDAGAIRAKAIERGVLSEDARPSTQELYNLVFDAGFSTAKTVSSVSGRGVGMDVVKRSIDALRGKVSIDSRPGEGSTVTVELPLTLAIIEGLLVEVDDEHYVLPLSLVEECIELSEDEVAHSNGNRLIEVRGELVPYMRLRENFGRSGRLPVIEQIVVTRLGETRFGFTVDKVIGQHQTVIKGLGKMYEGVSGLAGATILGDGAVALILDAHKLMQSAVETSSRIH